MQSVRVCVPATPPCFRQGLTDDAVSVCRKAGSRHRLEKTSGSLYEGRSLWAQLPSATLIVRQWWQGSTWRLSKPWKVKCSGARSSTIL